MNCPQCKSGDFFLWSVVSPAETYWCCSICALVWQDPAQRPSREKEEARYRTHVNSTNDSNYMNYLYRTADPVTKLLAPGALGLDYGCGPTEGMKALLSPLGFRVESYDPIFFPIDLPKNRYDFVLCSEAAEHFFHPFEEFQKIDEAMKVGAILGVSSWLAAPQKDFPQWNYRRDPTHVVFYQPQTVAWLARHLNWEILRLENPYWILKKR